MLIPKALVALAWAIVFGLAIGLPWGWSFSKFHSQVRAIHHENGGETQKGDPASQTKTSDEYVEKIFDPLAMSTYLLCIVTAWLAYNTRALFRVTAKLAADAKETALNQIEIMRGQLDEMQQSFAAERAYLYCTFKGVGDSPMLPGLSVTFTFKNFGKTPADIRNNGARCIYSANGFPKIDLGGVVRDLTDDTGKMPRGVVTIAADGEFGPFRHLIQATAEEIADARQGLGKIYCRMIIRYDDVRGCSHETAACFVYHFDLRRFAASPEEGANYHT